MKMRNFSQDDLTSSSRATRFLMNWVFALLILQYLIPHADENVRVIPIIVFCLAAMVYFVTAPGPKAVSAVCSVLQSPVLAFIVIAGFLPIISSYSTWQRSTTYGILMVGVLMTARILVSGIGLLAILESFYKGLAFTIPMIPILSFREFAVSLASGGRYQPFGFHPNAIAEFAAILVPLHIWFAPQGRAWNIFRWFSVPICLLIIIATGSRSALAALACGCLVVLTIRQLSEPTRGVRRSHLVIGLLLMLALCLAAFDNHVSSKIGGYVWDKLELDSPQRGLNSGMSGRSKAFESFSETLSDDITLFGNGYRSTDNDIDYAVDNGYLTIAYELGFIPVCAIVGRHLFHLIRAIQLYFRNRTPAQNMLQMYIGFISTFLLVATVGRGLFSYGDPISLLALCFLIASDVDFRGPALVAPAMLPLGSSEDSPQSTPWLETQQ